MNRVDWRRQREAGSHNMHPKGLRKELLNGDNKSLQSQSGLKLDSGEIPDKRGSRILGKRGNIKES